MVNARQRNDIKKLMKSIKEARDSGKPEYIIEQRTQELYNYLEKEGLVQRDE